MDGARRSGGCVMERTPTFTPASLPRRETNGIADMCRHAYALWLHMQPAGLLADPNETTRTLWAALRDAAREAGLEPSIETPSPAELLVDKVFREALAALRSELEKARAEVGSARAQGAARERAQISSWIDRGIDEDASWETIRRGIEKGLHHVAEVSND